MEGSVSMRRRREMLSEEGQKEVLAEGDGGRC